MVINFLILSFHNRVNASSIEGKDIPWAKDPHSFIIEIHSAGSRDHTASRKGSGATKTAPQMRRRAILFLSVKSAV